MKKLSVITLFALILSITAFANKSATPEFKGLANFNRTFPQATEIVYKVTDKFTKVSFTWHSLQLEAFYDLDGNPIGTSRTITVQSLPLSYLLNIKKEYPGFEPTEAIEFLDERCAGEASRCRRAG